MKTDIYLTETYVRVIKNPHKETNDKERFRPNRYDFSVYYSAKYFLCILDLFSSIRRV